MTQTPLVIIGAGGHGRELHDLVEAINEEGPRAGNPGFDFLGFLDDGNPNHELLDQRDAKVLGPIGLLESLPAEVQYVIGIGTCAPKRAIDHWASGIGRLAPVLTHPSAVIGRYGVRLSPGVVIFSGVSVTTNVTLGRHVHLNRHTTVGHDAVLGDYVTANPSAIISGNVTVESDANLGTGSVIIQGVTIGAGSVIGAGAAVIRDVPPGVTAVGVPALPTRRP
jgi:sugar O-acyltransferase (sialic acid O-acetyltransferase NeuD family)